VATRGDGAVGGEADGGVRGGGAGGEGGAAGGAAARGAGSGAAVAAAGVGSEVAGVSTTDADAVPGTGRAPRSDDGDVAGLAAADAGRDRGGGAR
jgi:hypothetical protein